MQVSVETTGSLERQMTVELPVSRVDDEVNSRLKSLSRTAKIDGFRKGKVPFSVVKSRYGSQVRNDVVGELIQSTFYEAVTQEKLKPAGSPSIESVNDEADKLEYKATFEVYPAIEVNSLEGKELEKAKVEIAEDDIDQTIQTILEQHKNWEESDAAAEEGDRVTIDFTGTIDGEAFKGNEGQNVPLELGSGRMISGFEDGLVGVKAGDEKTLELSFPEDYHFEEVAGKPVQFAVKVNKVEKAKLPELNDELFAMFGVTEGGEEAFRAEVRRNMQNELDKALASRLKNSVMDLLLEANEVDVPKALIQNEAQNMAKQMQQQFMQQGGQVDLDASMFEDQAKRRVSLGLLLAEVISANDIKATADEVKAKVEEVAANYEQPEEVVKFYFGDQNRLAEIESLLLEDKVVDWAMEQVSVTEKESAFKDFMSSDNVRA